MIDAMQPKVVWEKSPVPGVAVEAIRYLMTLPDEVRERLGNFLLDSTVEGFDGTPKRSARLWNDELQRRINSAIEQPERLLTPEEVFADLERHLDQLRRTPRPDHLHGYHCSEYFSDGWAEKGSFDDHSHCWIVEPLHALSHEQRHGFFAVGGPGVDGIRFCYRHGHHGLWAYSPVGNEFQFLANSLGELVEGWKSGKITV